MSFSDSTTPLPFSGTYETRQDDGGETYGGQELATTLSVVDADDVLVVVARWYEHVVR